jgi:hypothetical protein
MVASLEDMGELVDQFDTTEEGLQFIELPGAAPASSWI